MTREWRFISALRGTGVPAPEPLALADTAVLGVPFYVMSYVDGLVLHSAAEAVDLTPAARQCAAASLIDTMVALHQLDIDTVGLGDIGRREDYVGQQLRRWKRHGTSRRVPTSPLSTKRIGALRRPRRRSCGPVSRWGFPARQHDLRSRRKDPCGPGLELATLGDPLADFGWTLSWWAEPGPPDTTVVMPAAPPSVLPGFPPRQRLMARYADGTGADLDRIDFYLAFAYCGAPASALAY